MNEDRRLTYTVAETAAKLGISKNLAYSLASQNRLPGVIKLGGKRLVVSKAILNRVLNGETPGSDLDL